MTPAEAAIGYAKRGLRVLPIEPRGKQPLTHHGVKSASRDPHAIRLWWVRHPEANVAIAVPDAWRVLDVDPRNGGADELVRLLRAHGPLPTTIHARTGSGGEHILLAFPPGRYRGKVGPGLDLLGPGKYFLAAPSVHPCGGLYAWSSRPGTPIAPAPAWLVELARAADAPPPTPIRAPVPTGDDRVTRARAYLAKCPPAISGQGGHLATFLVAQKLVRGFALDEDTAFALLESDYNPQCQPPWSRYDLRRKVREAARAGQMQPGALLERSRRRA